MGHPTQHINTNYEISGTPQSWYRGAQTGLIMTENGAWRKFEMVVSVWRVWGSETGSNQNWVWSTVPQIWVISLKLQLITCVLRCTNCFWTTRTVFLWFLWTQNGKILVYGFALGFSPSDFTLRLALARFSALFHLTYSFIKLTPSIQLPKESTSGNVVSSCVFNLQM